MIIDTINQLELSADSTNFQNMRCSCMVFHMTQTDIHLNIHQGTN